MGNYFLDSVGADIDSLQIMSGIHSMSGNHYRFMSERFPYWIYYRIDGETAYIVAVLDARQNPDAIKQREKIDQGGDK